MSKYTTEVRFICETYAGLTESVGYDQIDDVIEDSYEQIFENFPIFDETYRKPLCKKILRHYYTREICAETVGLWKLWLNNKMNEIMPYYNKLYESELLKFNPFYDVDLMSSHARSGDTTREIEEDTEGNRTTNRSSVSDSERVTDNSSEQNTTNIGATDTRTEDKTDGTNWELYSDTPQGGVNGIEGISQGTYLTNATKNIDDTTVTGKGETSSTETGNTNAKSNGNERTDASANESVLDENKGHKGSTDTINTTEDYLEHVQGKQAGQSYSKLLGEYRKTFLNIDMMVIDELADLFFLLWE